MRGLRADCVRQRLLGVPPHPLRPCADRGRTSSGSAYWAYLHNPLGWVSEAVPITLVPVHAEPHLPLPAELPLVDEPAGTDVDLKTQIIRFTLTGGLSALVDFGLYVLLLNVLGLPVSVAKSIGFIAGTTTAYLINRRWTFQAPPSRARFAAVVALYATTFAVQVGINQVLYYAIGEQWWRVPLAFVVAQGTATVINFVVQRLVIFKIH
ncbi:putative flippase GtrA (transmembrane translocase of bactoprenol-linked glucose) [Nocardia amikacinitolerans]|nr:putative flippase GtrA (transmembrane translocase of bactoprenol-linked glucose) [Nocardia amikacinitolerans]